MQYTDLISELLAIASQLLMKQCMVACKKM